MRTPYWWADQPPVRRSTNGFAVASLVVSILWFLGLGSVLAIIFGLVARRQIRDSRGTQSGEGLAIAGLTIGILGIVGLAGFITLGLAVSHEFSPTMSTLRYGQTAQLSRPSLLAGEGLASINVESLTAPYTSTSTSIPAEPGHELAVATVQLCAGPSGVTHGFPVFSPSYQFDLLLPGGVTASPSLDARTPSVNDLGGLGPNQCGVGYVTFEVPMGQTPQGVRYRVLLPNQTYVWK